MAASALQSERYLVVVPRNHLLRMLPPRAPPLLFLPHRRCRRPPAVRASSGGGGGGFASAVEKRSVPEVTEEKGAERDGEGEVAGALELRWPPWEGLAERYKLIGATSLAFVICNMDKDVPWRQFFKSKAVWAMIYAHFCGSWGHYTCLSWLSTFFMFCNLHIFLVNF